MTSRILRLITIIFIPVATSKLADVTGEYELRETDVRKVSVPPAVGAELHQHWVDQAFSALIASVAQDRLQKKSRKDRKAHAQCTRNAHSVEAHAKCVSRLLKDANGSEKIDATSKRVVTQTKKRRETHGRRRKLVRKNGKMRRRYIVKSKRERKTKHDKLQEEPAFIQGGDDSSEIQQKPKYSDVPFRVKRHVRTSSSYTLPDSKKDPTDEVFSRLSHLLRAFKRKDDPTIRWQSTIARLKDVGARLKNKESVRKEFQDRVEAVRETAEALTIDLKQPLKILGVLDELSGNDYKEATVPFGPTYGAYPTTGRVMREDRERKEAEENETKRTLAIPIKLIREGVKLGMMLNGSSVDDFEKKDIKLFSPKLFEMSPDTKTDTVALFSPKVFSLHKNNTDPLDKQLSVESLLGSVGNIPHNDLMNFIIEVSGVDDAVDKLERLDKVETLRERARMDPRVFGDPSILEKIENGEIEPMEPREHDGLNEHDLSDIGLLIQRVMKNSSNAKEYKIQMLDFKSRGRTTLTPNQRLLFYGKGSPFANATALNSTEGFDDEKVDKHLEQTIHDLAVDGRVLVADNGTLEITDKKKKAGSEPSKAFIKCHTRDANGQCVEDASKRTTIMPVPYNKTEEYRNQFLSLNRRHNVHKRVKRWGVVLTPVAFLPVVGDPVLASQPFVLSPIIFTPIVLSPCVFGILVLSPWIFTPVIVAPRLLSPIILSPELWDPVVLSPLALDPIILSPGVGVPLILSPFLMTPFILSPQVMTPLILTPLCLSPIILTPHVLTPLVLSPFVLSPIILSPSYVGALVLSPSALSPAHLSTGAIFTAVLSPSVLS